MSNDINDRMPPSAVDSEKGILGSILLNKEIMLQVADILQPNYFYEPIHTEIYSLMLSLWERQMNIDILVILDKLNNRQKEAKDGETTLLFDKNFLLDLTGYASLIGNPAEHAQLIRDKFVLRSLVGISDEIKTAALKQDEEVADILDKAENKIFKLASANLAQDFVSISEILSTTFDRIEDLHAHQDEVRGVPTGFVDMDKLLGGFQNSDLVILGARPGMGKTAFSLSLCLNASLKNKTGTAIFSLEMSRDQLSDRMLSAVSGVELYKIRHGKFDDDSRHGKVSDFSRIGEGIAKLAEAPIWIDDSGSLNIMELRTKCRRLKSRYGIGLIVIDYLQLMSGRGSFTSQTNRVQEVSEISRSLKSLARELNVPILALSQLSRGVEGRDEKRPTLSDLRESGSIEQDADVVMFIYRDDVYNKKDKNAPPSAPADSNAEIIIAKHRNGATGTVELFFRKENTSFENKLGSGPSYRVRGE
jgi:replicative DNA helicase